MSPQTSTEAWKVDGKLVGAYALVYFNPLAEISNRGRIQWVYKA